MRAEIGGSTGDASGAEGVSASWTPSVVFAARVQEPAHRMSILGQLYDRSLQHPANRAMEPADLARPEAVAGTGRMDPRLPEKQPFDRSPSARQEPTPSGESEGTLEGLDPQPLERPKVLLGLHKIHVAKTPLVHEA